MKKKETPTVPKVNTSAFKPKDSSYVCWIDIMGTRAIMSESFEKATNFILRFHAICMQSIRNLDTMKCYPLMDGVFLTSQDIDTLKKCIDTLFNNLAKIFCDEELCAHQFIVRGSIAKGGMSYGENIDESICVDIASNNDYKANLLFGMPMIQAYKTEKNAPPFGIYIHESARDYDKLIGRYYGWCKDADTRTTMMKELKQYFDWCKYYSHYLEMDKNKIDTYKELVEEYFSNRNASKNE